MNKQTDIKYHYSEELMAFLDLLTNPSRTILTGVGGAGASRFKHIVEIDGRYRRLVPDEFDRLRGFPKGWPNDVMSDGHRSSCTGNALVVGIPHRIGCELAKRAWFGKAWPRSRKAVAAIASFEGVLLCPGPLPPPPAHVNGARAAAHAPPPARLRGAAVPPGTHGAWKRHWAAVSAAPPLLRVFRRPAKPLRVLSGARLHTLRSAGPVLTA
ncbi:MAG: DNA cytosine methyltransferase, partial [Eggerthellaceae bacterium]|nr:DNA cytosine methyltransferase [Eggerthellaceae bacterium]